MKPDGKVVAAKPAPGTEPWDALWPSRDKDKSVPLLQALHILTRERALNADSRRKLKQVLHLTQLLRPALWSGGFQRSGAELARDRQQSGRHWDWVASVVWGCGAIRRGRHVAAMRMKTAPKVQPVGTPTASVHDIPVDYG